MVAQTLSPSHSFVGTNKRQVLQDTEICFFTSLHPKYVNVYRQCIILMVGVVIFSNFKYLLLSYPFILCRKMLFISNSI